MSENQISPQQPTLFKQSSTSNTVSVTIIPGHSQVPITEDPMYTTLLNSLQIELIQKAQIDGYMESVLGAPTIFNEIATIHQPTEEEIIDTVDEIEPTNLDDFISLKITEPRHYFIDLQRHNLEHFNTLTSHKNISPLPLESLFAPCELHSTLVDSIYESTLEAQPDLFKESTPQKWSFISPSQKEQPLKKVLSFLHS